MLRVRFHGRGGQGIKTASQILGTAAFLSGFQSQDFPLYGAERRGAPIVAFTRINKTPILERGPISIPDFHSRLTVNWRRNPSGGFPSRTPMRF